MTHRLNYLRGSLQSSPGYTGSVKYGQPKISQILESSILGWVFVVYGKLLTLIKGIEKSADFTAKAFNNIFKKLVTFIIETPQIIHNKNQAVCIAFCLWDRFEPNILGELLKLMIKTKVSVFGNVYQLIIIFLFSLGKKIPFKSKFFIIITFKF